ncbi:TPA: tail fiber domain-containing protein [Stenotrophomonas maltophilia]
MVDVKISGLLAADALTGSELLAGLQGTKNVKILVSAIRKGLLDVGGMDAPVENQSIYFSGTAWATYTVTSVARTLLAATTQAAQRTAIQAAGTVGDESIAGIKTYTGANPIRGLAASTGFWFESTGGQYGFLVSTDGNRLNFNARNSGFGSQFARVLQINVDSQQFSTPYRLQPDTDNTQSIGSAAARWANLYVFNPPITGSDARLKTEPRQLRDAEFKAASAIARLPAVWRWLSRVNGDGCEPEGTEARKHFGPTVQAAIAVMEGFGLDPFAYSFICYDQWEAEPEQWHEWPAKAAVLDEKGNELEPAVEAGRELIQPAREAGDRYSFRKEEMLCFIVRALAQEIDLMAAKFEELDLRVAAIESVN